MHEIGIMEQTLQIAINNALQKNAHQIKRITMRIGKLSGVIPEALEFAFDVVIKGTIAENSTLKIETIPITCYCDYCQEKFAPEEWFFECPNCHQFSQKILQGKEIELVSIEVS